MSNPLIGSAYKSGMYLHDYGLLKQRPSHTGFPGCFTLNLHQIKLSCAFPLRVPITLASTARKVPYCTCKIRLQGPLKLTTSLHYRSTLPTCFITNCSSIYTCSFSGYYSRNPLFFPMLLWRLLG
jgi:hypothetical protein